MMNAIDSLRVLLFVVIQIVIGLAWLLQSQIEPLSTQEGATFKLYFRFPTFFQQFSLIILILLSLYKLIRILLFLPTPFTQFVVYYECCLIFSMFIALKQDGVKNIPSLLKKSCWGFVYSLFLLHNFLDFYYPPNVYIDDHLLLFSLIVVNVCLLVLSIVSTVYRPFKIQDTQPPLEFTSDLIPYVSFAYNNGLIQLGRVFKSLKLELIPSLSDGDSSKYLSDQFNRILQTMPFHSISSSSAAGFHDERNSSSSEENHSEKNGDALLLFRSLFVLVWKEWVQQAFFQFMGSVSMFLSPLALQTMLLYVKYQGGKQYIEESVLHLEIWSAVLLLFLAPFLKGIGDGGNYVRGRHIGIRVKSALICAIYSKALVVDLSATKETVGKLMNLMSVDVNEIQNFCCYSHFLWSTALEILICTTLLFTVLGASAFAGLFVMVFSLFLAFFLGLRLEKYQSKLLKNKDKRMEIMHEVLQSIRIIKYFAWEKNFAHKINAIRLLELSSLLLYTFMNAVSYILWEVVPSFVGVAAFLTFTMIQGKALSVSVGFTGMVLFNLLRFPLGVFPDMINLMIRARVSMTRVYEFLSSADVEGIPRLEDASMHCTTGALELYNVATAWNATLSGKEENGKGEEGKKKRRKSKSETDENRSAWFEGLSCRGQCSSMYNLVTCRSQADASYDLLPSSSAHGENVPSSTSPEIGSHRVVLQNLNFKIPPKSFTVIIGTTGAGKTSLIQGSILGEALILSGERLCNGKLSYSSQTSWIQNATLRDNILFGQEYNEERYQRIIQACALVEDFQSFPAGDLTELGEKGVNLSGGQSQRVNLARASYADSDIILMDDPLSAVDTKVAEHIFKNLILNELKDRTRLLVTHNLSLILPHAQQIIILDDKQQSILCQGSPKEILEQLETTLAVFSNSESNDTDVGQSFLLGVCEVLSTSLRPGAPVTSSPSKVSLSRQTSSGSETSHHRTNTILHRGEEEHLEEGNSKSTKQTLTQQHQLVDDETKQVGDVPFSVYWFYLSAGGGVITTITLFSSCIWIAASWFLQNYNLGQWMEAMESSSGTKHDAQVIRNALFFYLLSVSSVVFAFVFRSALQISASLTASKVIHEGLLKSVLLATCGWFESTPTGRIISRFSQDVATVDSDLMNHLLSFIDCAIGTAQVVTVICYFMPLLLFPLLPVILYTFWVTYQYLCISREIKRLESISKSPVFVLFSETLNGLPIIRAYRQEKRFYSLCCERVDNMNRCHLYLWICNRWLNFRMQVLGAVVAGCVGIAVVYYTSASAAASSSAEGSSSVSASAAGLALLYSMGFCDNLTFLARAHADTQMNLNSVERIREYSELTPEKYEMTEEEKAGFATSYDQQMEERAFGSNNSCIRLFRRFPCLVTLLQAVSLSSSSNLLLDEDDEEEDNDENHGNGEGLELRSLRIHDEHEEERHFSMIPAWPSAGEIVFDKVVLQYPSASYAVLNQVSFHIHPGNKIGVCGRSGAGKSSLIVALFRIVEPLSGRILIDQKNILDLPLYEVRKNIAIVPQDPTLFKGTLRFNLDPFNEYSDQEIWSVLVSVQLSEVMKRLSKAPTNFSASSSEENLTTAAATAASPLHTPNERLQDHINEKEDENILDRVMIAEKGSNLSVGQRQLLCMARAMLRKTKVLILDECTASIDHETDAIIQNVVRTQLSHCTVISIAHRLHTIAYYDAVLVMDRGRMMEYDHPYKLMLNTGTIFHKMCRISGAYDELLSIAAQQFQDNEHGVGKLSKFTLNEIGEASNMDEDDEAELSNFDTDQLTLLSRLANNLC